MRKEELEKGSGKKEALSKSADQEVGRNNTKSLSVSTISKLKYNLCKYPPGDLGL